MTNLKSKLLIGMGLVAIVSSALAQREVPKITHSERYQEYKSARSQLVAMQYANPVPPSDSPQVKMVDKFGNAYFVNAVTGQEPVIPARNERTWLSVQNGRDVFLTDDQRDSALSSLCARVKLYEADESVRAQRMKELYGLVDERIQLTSTSCH